VVGRPQNLRAILGRRHWHTCLFLLQVTTVVTLRIRCAKKKGTAELLSKNKENSPMIKGMDVMESETAKYKFEREKKSTHVRSI
jgi:hypothetical protein